MKTANSTTQDEVARRWFETRETPDETLQDSEVYVQNYMLCVAWLFQRDRPAEARALLTHALSICHQTRYGIEVPSHLRSLIDECDTVDAFTTFDDLSRGAMS